MPQASRYFARPAGRRFSALSALYHTPTHELFPIPLNPLSACLPAVSHQPTHECLPLHHHTETQPRRLLNAGTFCCRAAALHHLSFACGCLVTACDPQLICNLLHTTRQGRLLSGQPAVLAAASDERSCNGLTVKLLLALQATIEPHRLAAASSSGKVLRILGPVGLQPGLQALHAWRQLGSDLLGAQAAHVHCVVKQEPAAAAGARGAAA